MPLSNNPSVLVVDDFVDGREMVAEYLSFRGFDVIEARDGDEAIALARTRKPQIVLMDLQMPGTDGWEATRRLKSDPATRDIPVVALTAHALKREVDAAREAGCDAVVAKPCDITALADALSRMLRIGPRAFDIAGLRSGRTASRAPHGKPGIA